MRRSLRLGDQDVELWPKSFDVLVYLARHARRLVTKSELCGWPRVVVTDESLARCVSDIRVALRDREQRMIKTLPGRGYVLAAPMYRDDTEQGQVLSFA